MSLRVGSWKLFLVFNLYRNTDLYGGRVLVLRLVVILGLNLNFYGHRRSWGVLSHKIMVLLWCFIAPLTGVPDSKTTWKCFASWKDPSFKITVTQPFVY